MATQNLLPRVPSLCHTTRHVSAVTNQTRIPYPETADIATSSDDYASRFAGPVGAWMLDTQTRLALDGLRRSPSPVHTVLDVGGGHGQLAGPLAAAGYAVTVIGSDACCAHRLAPLLTSGACAFVTGNVIALPFPDLAFDAVLSFRLLPHCAQWERLVGELCRVARHTVVVDYPTRRSLNCVAPALFGAKQKLEGNTRTWRLFSDREVRNSFDSNGFSITRRCGQFFLPMVLHRALRCRPLSQAAEAVSRALGLNALFGSPVILTAQLRAEGRP